MNETLAGKLRPFLLTTGIILADQVSKAFIALKWPKDGTFIKDVFDNDLLWIIHVRNKAIAFSLGNGLPEGLRTLLFVLLHLAVLGALVWYYFRSGDFTTLQRWAVAGILGGGAGNLIDRIFRSDGVVDFVSVKFFGLFGLSRWPTFNIADSSVVVCGILLFLSVTFVGAGEHEKELRK